MGKQAQKLNHEEIDQLLESIDAHSIHEIQWVYVTEEEIDRLLKTT